MSLDRDQRHGPAATRGRNPYAGDRFTAAEAAEFVAGPCPICGSTEITIQWIQLAPDVDAYVHGLETCHGCAARRGGHAGRAPV